MNMDISTTPRRRRGRTVEECERIRLRDNQSERKRQRGLKDLQTNLESLLPSDGTGKKRSLQNTLDAGTLHIKDLQRLSRQQEKLIDAETIKQQSLLLELERLQQHPHDHQHPSRHHLQPQQHQQLFQQQQHHHQLQHPALLRCQHQQLHFQQVNVQHETNHDHLHHHRLYQHQYQPPPQHHHLHQQPPQHHHLDQQPPQHHHLDQQPPQHHEYPWQPLQQHHLQQSLQHFQPLEHHHQCHITPEEQQQVPHYVHSLNNGYIPQAPSRPRNVPASLEEILLDIDLDDFLPPGLSGTKSNCW